MVEIVAEISGNHGGSLDRAFELIALARDCGCHYAKFQYYKPEDMPDLSYLTSEMYNKLAVPDEWLDKLFLHAQKMGIGLFASVFSARAARKLCEYDIPYIKIASPESTRLSLRAYKDIMSSVPVGVHLIISTGAKDREKMDRELRTIVGASSLMYCPPGHPPELTVEDYQEFVEGYYSGFSDHTAGIRAPLAFISAGATMIEKHLKLNDHCIDAAFSADWAVMRLLCRLADR